ncbi:MAG: ATPase [Pseudonocardiales bacterium]|nr:MAG: ATPase [Pseudonocardiales bacterium]
MTPPQSPPTPPQPPQTPPYAWDSADGAAPATPYVPSWSAAATDAPDNAPDDAPAADAPVHADASWEPSRAQPARADQPTEPPGDVLSAEPASYPDAAEPPPHGWTGDRSTWAGQPVPGYPAAPQQAQFEPGPAARPAPAPAAQQPPRPANQQHPYHPAVQQPQRPVQQQFQQPVQAPVQPQPQQPVQPQPQQPVRQAPPSADDLSPAALLRAKGSAAPSAGWRRAVYALSGHSVNPGMSRQETARQQLIRRATVPVHGCYRIAVISLKGGVGKTTMTVCFGATLASLRGDRVIAVDANPDRGTLSGKIPLETTATVRNLLNDVGHVERYSDVRRYTSQSPDRLEVLASESDPSVSQAFSEADYRTVASVLERFYNIVLTDCGTGLLHSAMAGVLALAHQIVVVSSGSVDGARSASATIDWLEAHGYSSLVRGSVAVINSVRPKSGSVDIDRLEEHFRSRCRAVARIPYDPHLEEGAEVDLAELRDETRLALLGLAADIADGFVSGARHPQGSGQQHWFGQPREPHQPQRFGQQR